MVDTNPAAELPAPASEALTPASETTSVAAVSAPPDSPTPVIDVLEYLRAALISVLESAAPLAELQPDLVAMLGLDSDWTTTQGTFGHPGTRLGQPFDALSHLFAPWQSAAGPEVPGAGIIAPPPELAGLPAFKYLSASVAQSPPNAGMKLPSLTATEPLLITGAVTTLLASVSLWALLSAALPGLGGLMATGATGVRIGYRQARAGLALHRTDLARFAPTGPLGVVVADSSVIIRLHTARATAPKGRHLEAVA